MHRVDAEVGVVAEHGDVVVALVFGALPAQVGPAGAAPPQAAVHGHDLEGDLRVLLDVLFAQAPAELPQGNLVRTGGHDGGDQGDVGPPCGVDGGHDADLLGRFEGLLLFGGKGGALGGHKGVPSGAPAKASVVAGPLANGVRVDPLQ